MLITYFVLKLHTILRYRTWLLRTWAACEISSHSANNFWRYLDIRATNLAKKSIKV